MKYKNIFSEMKDAVIISVMNTRELHIPTELDTSDFALITSTLMDAYMNKAKENEDVKQFLALLKKMKIVYTFKFITVAYYS